MAILPKNFTGKDVLQPGSRGQVINPSMPGYRDGADRVTRTQTNLPVNKHDVPNIKWELDRRLPALFKYGYDFGYNQIVIPKGRAVALDKNINQMSFDDKKAHNVLTLANGGNWTTRQTETVNACSCENGHTAPCTGYNGKEFIEISGAAITVGSENIQTSSHVIGSGYVVTVGEDGQTTAVKDGKTVEVIAPNVPVGMIQKNQHTVDDNAMNGYMPGPVLTDAMVELPLFATRDKAEENPWGSAYGTLLPGDLVKADANGRFTVSPLSRTEVLFGAGESAGLSAAQIEYERQQVIGQVYEVNRDLVPFGSSKYVQWALSDRMNFNEFAPDERRANFRNGEDLNETSAFGKTGGGTVKTTDNMTGMDDSKFPGYPYNNTMTEHDLHMLASTVRKAGNRMSLEHTLDQGIPGLTDGYNAYVGDYGPEVISTDLRAAGEGVKHTDVFMRLSKVNVVTGSVKLSVGDGTGALTQVVQGATLTPVVAGVTADATDALKVKFLNELQGLIVLEIVEEDKWRAFVAEAQAAKKTIDVRAAYQKRGLAGVPTFLDWDGCQGVVSILLER